VTDPRRGPAAPAGDHLDHDALVDVLAGERPDDPHLRACPRCRQRLAELQAAEVEVVANLARLPDPVLPEGLAERLEAAMRAEAPLERVGGRGSPGGARTASVTTLPQRRRSWLPAAAAAVALVLAGGLAWPALQSGPGDDTAESTAAGDVGEQAAGGGAAESAGLAAVRNDSGTDYADEAQRTAALPQVLAGTARGRDVPGAGDAEADGPAAMATAAASLERLRDPALLQDCLSALQAPEQPLALDYARFGEEPALAVVLPDPDPERLSLYVVGAGCSAADERLLLYARPDRP